jgi:Domain of unknown function (DUF4190)
MSAPGGGSQNPYDGANQPPDGPPQASFPPQYPGVSQGYSGYPYGPHLAGPARTNGSAIGSLVISIVGAIPALLGMALTLYDPCAVFLQILFLLVCTPLGIVAMVLGIVALVQIRRRKERGRALAIGGIVLSVVPLVILLVLVYWFHHY